MSNSNKIESGSITWVDLTVPNAKEVRDFYCKTVGWKASEVGMGNYSDFNMALSEGGEPVAGICHSRGENRDLPAQWLIYITVEDVDKSAANCHESGGSVLIRPKKLGNYGRYCVIRDPAGAVVALFEPSK